jgi:hypothetical protein
MLKGNLYTGVPVMPPVVLTNQQWAMDQLKKHERMAAKSVLPTVNAEGPDPMPPCVMAHKASSGESPSPKPKVKRQLNFHSVTGGYVDYGHDNPGPMPSIVGGKEK